MLQTENSMLKHQIRRTEKALEEANHETSQKEEKVKQLTKDNRSLLTTVNKLWQVLQRKMEMADSSVIYRENGVDIDSFETCTEEENLKH
jgi:CHASE3 domain sensor protein